MNEVINSCLMVLNSIGRGFCNYAAGIFVQSSVLIVLLLLITFLTRKHVRATFRYWIWILVFIKLILPPTLSLPTSIGYWYGDYFSKDLPVLQQATKIARPETAGIPVSEALEDFVLTAEIPLTQPSQIFAEPVAPVLPVASAVSEVSDLSHITWQAVVFGLWLVGVLLISVLLIKRMSFVKGLIAQSKPSDERLAQMLNQCRRQVGIGRNIELRLTNDISGPAVCGLFKPVILMPANLDGKLSPDKLRAVLIHELAHIQRGDLWINLVQTILQIIYFYNPFVWIANAVVRSTREQAVDEMVLVALGEEARSYSNTLIDIAEMAFFRTSLSLRLIGVVESKKALHRRIKIMLNRPVPKRAKLGILGLVVIIIIGAILLPMAKGNWSWSRKDRIDELVKKLSSEDNAVWEPAAEQLKEIGPKVAQQVAGLFGTATGDLHAIRVLESMATNEHVQDVMVQGLSAENSGVRLCSLIILSKSGNRDHVKRIIPLLRKDVENSEDYSMAAIALAELGGDNAYNALVETVTKDIPDQLRWMITDDLVRMGRADALPYLKDALKLVDPSHPSAGARIVEAIHRLEDKNEIVEKPYNGLYSFTLHEFDSKYSRGGYLYARDLQRANDAGMYVDKPPTGVNAEETISGGLRALAASSKGDLIFERVGEQTRFQAYHGTLLAPLEVKIEPPHHYWTDVVEEMNQSELKQLVLDYNSRHAKDIAGSIPGFRLYPFDEGDKFAAVSPNGQIATLAIKKIESHTSCVRLNVLYLDPLLALVGTGGTEASRNSTADVDKWWRPEGNILDSDHVPSQYSRMTVEPDEAHNMALQKNSMTASESTKVDIAIDDRDFEVTKLSDELYQAVIRIYNKGSAPSPEFGVYFYAGDPDKGGRLLATHAAGPIMPGDSWAEGTHPHRLEPGENTISVVVDPDNKVEELDETNNKAARTISTLASESEKVDKVGAIQKVDLLGNDILQVEAQASEGFNFPYYLFVPGGIDKDRQVYMLVETNNSGTVSDDLEFHQAKALMLAKRSHTNKMAKRLGVPLLVPTFPRPRTNWQAYTHALDIDTLEIEEGKLKRIDMQLTAMIKHAQELLKVNGFKINERIFMHGFSASAKFCNRYSFLHPEMVKAVAAGGVNGLPTLPVRRWNECELPFPIGIAGIERFIDGPFNEKAFGHVAHYIYMGSLDRNDTLPSRDAWRQEEADIIKKALAEKMMPDRWELTRKIYRQQKLPAQLVTYNGVTHAIKGQMLNDITDFFKANSREKFVRIEPYEYPFVKSEEIRPKHKSESAKIDIAIDDRDLVVTKQPDGLFKALIRIYNKGSMPIPQFGVDFYAGDPDKGGRLLATHAAGPIMPSGNWGEYNPRLKLRTGENTISVLVDPGNRVEELDETNNKATRKISTTVKVKPDSDSETQPKNESALAKADIAIENKYLTVKKQPDGRFRAGVSIHNYGNTATPQFKVIFYAGDPGKKGRKVYPGHHNAGPIMPRGTWNEGTLPFTLNEGETEIFVIVDPDNMVDESDETNNKASQKISTTVKIKSAESKEPTEMVGTWFFDNPRGDEEQMAVFPDGRVVVLYSNGHKDRTNIVNGFIELAEYKNAKCRMVVREDGILVQYFGRSESSGKRWRRISPVPHTNLLKSLSGSPEDKWKYFVTLPNDLTVELIGVCEHPSKGKQWWRPNGGSLPNAPYESREGQPIENRDKETNRLVEFAISFVGSQLPYTDVCYQVSGSTRTSGGGDVRPSSGVTIKSIACEISKSRDTAEVRLGVAAGQWKTITEYDGGRGGFVGPDDIVFSDPIETKQGIAIAVRGEWGSEGARRITAVDKNGNTHTGGWSGRSTGLKTLATTQFYNVKPEQIQKYQLQFRPYEWVEFKNVSLRPGHKTNVQFSN